MSVVVIPIPPSRETCPAARRKESFNANNNVDVDSITDCWPGKYPHPPDSFWVVIRYSIDEAIDILDAVLSENEKWKILFP